jgi:hypothetical protein
MSSTSPSDFAKSSLHSLNLIFAFIQVGLSTRQMWALGANQLGIFRGQIGDPSLGAPILATSRRDFSQDSDGLSLSELVPTFGQAALKESIYPTSASFSPLAYFHAFTALLCRREALNQSFWFGRWLFWESVMWEWLP